MSRCSSIVAIAERYIVEGRLDTVREVTHDVAGVPPTTLQLATITRVLRGLFANVVDTLVIGLVATIVFAVTISVGSTGAGLAGYEPSDDSSDGVAARTDSRGRPPYRAVE